MDKNYFTELKNGSRLKPKSLKKENEDLYNKILDFSQKNGLNNLPFKEVVWLFVENKTEKPKCCECGGETKFERFGTGYRTYCSMSCKSKNVLVKEKVKKTFIEKYGGHPMTNDKVKGRVENTNLERYGHKSHLKSEKIKQKIESTNLDKYGVKRPLESKEIQDKTKDTMIKNHGVSHGLQSDKIRKKTFNSYINNNNIQDVFLKIKETKKERYGDENYNNKFKNSETCLKKYGVKSVLESDSPFRKKIGRNKFINSIKKYKHGNKINVINIGDECTILCDECGLKTTIKRQFLTIRGNLGKIMCLNCNPYGNIYSNSEVELEMFLSNIEYIKKDRSILDGKEIDILIPSIKLGIEYNGLYWHSEKYKDNYYHLSKTKLANSKGYQLIHIFEDEWYFKEDIVKSIINNKLGLIDKKIYARKCEIKLVNSKDSSNFLNENHIQGKINSSVKIGLYYDGELVSLMTFGKLRKSLGSKHIDGHWEMLRFCNKLNYNVIGGASKLFKHFVKNYDVDRITSYSDNRYFSGGLYEKLGFIYDGDTKPSYWYTKNISRYHRFKFRKDILVSEGFDPNKTEKEIMKSRGYNRIWDCGNKKWIFINK
jgi:hypothetical protein